MPRAGLDPSWVAVLSHAYNKGWQFGADIVFTFGPFGFIYANLFDPLHFTTTLAIWCVLAIVFASCVTFLLNRRRPFECAIVLLSLFLGLRSSSVDPMLFNDPLLFLLPLLLVLTRAHPDRRVSRWLIAALLALIALSGLIKFTFALLGLATVILIEASRLRLRPRVPVYVLSYALLMALFFVAAGQHITNFPAYISGSIAITDGYSEAMQVFQEPGEIIRFVVMCVLFVAAACYLELRRNARRAARWSGVAPLLALIAFLFVVFKAGFVRHDIHALIAWSSLSAGIAVYSAHLLRMIDAFLWRTCLLIFCIVAAATALLHHGGISGESPAEVATSHFGTGLVARARAVDDILRGDGLARLRQDYEAALSTIRDHHPIGDIAGSVDIYPWNAVIVLAHGLDYRPRPVFQSFAVYNEKLRALNRAHLGSNRAASTILFDVESIDGRFVAQDDGPLWIALLMHYEPAGAEPSQYLRLRRRAAPRAITWRSLATYKTTWSQPLQVPSSEHLVWVQIILEQPLHGRLVNAVFKSPVVELVLTLDDGTESRYRLVPGMARQGFLLSPTIDSIDLFSGLFDETRELHNLGPRVIGLRISEPEPRRLHWMYADEIKVTFQELSFKRDAFADGGPSSVPAR